MWILITVLIIIVPFVTNFASTAFFFRTRNSRSLNKRPPTVPYWFPGVYHALAFASGTSANFAKLIKEYGHFAPFVVKAGPYSYLILRNVDHIKKILHVPKQFTARTLKVELFTKVMGSPKEALAVYKGINTGNEDSKEVEYAHSIIAQKFLADSSLISLAGIYTKALSQSLANKMFQPKHWTSIEDLWSFFQHEVTRLTAETIFGTAFLKHNPRLVKDFWQFHGNFEHYTPGLPRPMQPLSYTFRDRLIENIKTWLQATHGGTDFAKLDDADPEWDEKLGSKYFQARDAVFAKIPAMAIYQTRAAEALAVLHGMNSLVMPSTFWFIVEVLRDPNIVKYLLVEIAKHRDSATGAYDLAALAALPIVQSIHAEVQRIRIATVAVRKNEGAAFKLDDNWTVPKGMSVVAFSQDLALNTEAWHEARPQTVEKPLAEFWAERFLVPDDASKKAAKRGGKLGTGRFSMDGLEGLHLVSSSGDAFYPGDSFARVVEVGTLAVLLSEWDITLCDAEDIPSIVPPLREVAYGTVKPLDKVSILIRQKDMSGRK